MFILFFLIFILGDYVDNSFDSILQTMDNRIIFMFLLITYPNSNMANIKSAEKRNRQNIKRRAQNRVLKGSSRTALKNARALIDANDPAAAEAVATAMQSLDKAASSGIIHANNASRRKSRLALALNKMAATS